MALVSEALGGTALEVSNIFLEEARAAPLEVVDLFSEGFDVAALVAAGLFEGLKCYCMIGTDNFSRPKIHRSCETDFPKCHIECLSVITT